LTQVFFYHDATDRLAAAATLIAKASAQKKPVLVFAPDTALADAIDRQLWLQPVGGFVAHVRADSPLAAETPVVIAQRLDSPAQCERLFNLAEEIPDAAERFAAIIEVVGAAPESRNAGRERVRGYRERGFEIRFFDLSGHG
jgi:DNA polymerase-3 subunit chi